MDIQKMQRDLKVRGVAQTERWLATIKKSIRDAVIAIDENSNIKLINPVAEKFTGWKAEEAQHRPLKEVFTIIDELTGEPIESPLEKVFGSGSGQLHHTVLIRRDGSEIPIETTGTPVNDEDGRLIGIVLVFSYISKRRHIDRKADKGDKSERMFRTLAEASHDMIYILDRDGRIRYVNNFAAEQFNMSIEELKGKTQEELFPPGIARNHKEKILKVFETGHEYYGEERIKFPEYNTWIDERLFPILDKNGNVNAVLGISSDITEKKKTEESLRFAKEKAEAASREKNRFLAHISHEIRTPLNAINGFADLLSKTHVSDLQRDYINIICESANVLLSLIEDILDVSMIESGGLRLEIEEFDIDYLVEKVIKMLRLKFKDSKVIFNVEFKDKTPGMLLGDQTRVSQILLNLLNNSLKFTSSGEIYLSIGLGDKSPGKSADGMAVLRISVKDTGIGIPANKQNVIFDAFVQAATTTSRKYGGTGLGLTITKALVEMMDGNITCISEEGKGTEFIVTFRLKVGGNIQRKHEHSSILARLKGKSVLIIDENKNSKRILSGFIKRAGMKADFKAGSFDEAIKYCRSTEKKPDFIIMDIDMLKSGELNLLEKSGTGPLCKLTFFDTPSDARIIGITRELNAEQVAQKMNFICDAFLLRPVLWSEFLEAMGGKTYDNALPDEAAESDEEDNAFEEPQPLKGIKILMAEDNEINQKLQKIMLMSLGCEVDIAGDGKEAIEKASNNEYNAIVMDLSMPVVSGIEATIAIRDFNRDIPIIALTAYARKQDGEKCIKIGMNDYIAKPIKAKELREKLLKCLDKS